MNLTETAQLLTTASAIDHIARSDEDVIAWQACLADVDYGAAQSALRRHLADPRVGTEFLKPAHITAQLAAVAPSLPLPPRAGEGMCPIHVDYPLIGDTGHCDQCRRHPEDLQPGAPAPTMVPLGTLADLDLKEP